MIAHPAFEREFELWKFAPQFSPRCLGQLAGLVLTGDDDSYHQPPGNTECVAGNGADLEVGIFENFLNPVCDPAAIFNQGNSIATKIAPR